MPASAESAEIRVRLHSSAPVMPSTFSAERFRAARREPISSAWLAVTVASSSKRSRNDRTAAPAPATAESESRAWMRPSTSPASSAKSPAESNIPGTAAPGSSVMAARAPGPGPGITDTTVPPSIPPERSSEREPAGTCHSPSTSRVISTLSPSIAKRWTRPMLIPRIWTGSPFRMPWASCTRVTSM